VLDARFAGREYDERLLAELPAGVDPCGENGEFHTFVHDGPGFAAPLAVRTGEVVERDGFVFADVVPV
jgi:diphthamide synthase (EF-2-diphthine--ammonia ligase)